jgi:hypothetical protein
MKSEKCPDEESNLACFVMLFATLFLVSSRCTSVSTFAIQLLFSMR